MSGHDDDFYGMHPYYDDWRFAVVNGDTCLGLHEWARKEMERDKGESG